MSFDIELIGAETHTAEYLMHKYWARKPHNVINKCFSSLLKKNGKILDPFCGSGVSIREGALLGHDCDGFDLNPIAYLITDTLVHPPKVNDFMEAYTKIYDCVYQKYGSLYKTVEGYEIKYLSHRIISKCQCGLILKVSDCNRDGKKMICPNCGSIVRYNLESLTDTEVFDVVLEDKKKIVNLEDTIRQQIELSKYLGDINITAKYNYKFPENRRILAFDGITTSKFFTNRNFAILCEFSSEIDKIENVEIKKVLKLILTGSVAQCSRLIAHRNNLSTGGPAWSIPGFWVPCEHLETNPFVHITARYKKFIKALTTLEKKPIKGNAVVKNVNSLYELKKEENANKKYDLIFLDPPYGDSVPYTEFSNIWNSFLNIIPDSNQDISVSDRIDKKSAWNFYSTQLNEFMSEFAKHLSEDGKLLITFNNNDMRAWTALLSSLQNNGFICKSVFYQIPAVISSKAQMSINSSYISDIYSVYALEDKTPSADLSLVIKDIVFITNSRKGKITKNCLDREFIVSWIRNNISFNLLSRKDELIEALFIYDKKNQVYTLKDEYVQDVEKVESAVITETTKLLKKGPVSLLDAYKNISSKIVKFGTIELQEFKSFLKDFVIENNIIYGESRTTLFDFIEE